MENLQRVSDLGQIRLLADGRRLAILQRLMAGPATLTQLGQAFGKHPAWIRHHIKQLEKAGLVHLHSTRPVYGVVEKYYCASASAYAISALVAPASPAARPKASGEPVAQNPPAEQPTASQPLEPGEVKVGPPAGAEATATPPPAPPPTAEATPAAKPTSAATTAAGSGTPLYPEPAPGQTFLQVAAVRRAEAESLVDVLKRKGFPALVAPGPSETLFRVLVGPLKDEDDIARTRQRLEEAGFRSSYVRKY